MKFTTVYVIVSLSLYNNIDSQCIGPAGPLANGYGLAYGAGLGLSPAVAPVLVAPGIATYATGLAPIETLGACGGAGIGDVAVAGEMPVVGTTLVAGQVPILGSVRFAGDLPAAGTVYISGSCGCGDGAYIY